MRNWRLFLLVSCAVFLILAPVAPAAQDQALFSPRLSVRTYLPGDFVHLVVQAPVDTSQITATLPDGAVVNLIQDRRTNIWRGIWQVPDNFAKGTYSADLTAVDVQGNVFSGQTDAFDVGELKLITLVGMASPEVAAPPAPPPVLLEEITAEVAPSRLPGEEELISLIKKIVTPLVPPPAPEAAPSEMAPELRDRLVASNMVAGRDALQQGKYSEAASFFRIVLYLVPDNKEAGQLLAQAQQQLALQKKLQAAQHRRLYLMLAGGGFFVFAFLLALFALLYQLARRPLVAVPAPPGPPQLGALSEGERQKLWFEKMGWKKGPFSADVIQQLFPDGSRLELEGLKNYLKVRIKEVGGQGLEPFTDSALEKIFNLSKGDPAQAMKICEWALSQAGRRGEYIISAELVRGYEQVGSPRVLIADDEEVIRSVLDTILRRGGCYETDFAADGEETLKKIKENAYDLILLDLDMPRMSGYDVLKEVRLFAPELPIIFVTGKGEPQKVVESLSQHNLDGYIEKPFVPEKVLDVVARALKK
ncbi:MAG: response regulator [Candidatus Saganbacteria bacterium]|nr:response regulator [Candidatus Saganbacteria bacterium]